MSLAARRRTGARRRRAKGIKVFIATSSCSRTLFERAALSMDWRYAEREPQVALIGFGDSSIDFEVRIWIDDPWVQTFRLSDLYRAIWRALRDADITIAFPQLDVHLDPDVSRALASGGRPGDP